MNDESDVRGWLATADVPDLRPLDFEETVTAGRTKARRQRTGRIAGTAALVLAALLAVPGTLALLNDDTTDASPAARRTPPPDGPFSCTYQALPVPTGLDAIDAKRWHLEPNGMDPSGRYIIAQALTYGGPNGPRTAVLWDNGVGRVISPDLRGLPTAVSEKGVVAGKRVEGRGAWIYRDGVVSDLAVPAGATDIEIRKINANGDLLGIVETAGTGRTTKVAIWKAGDLANPRTLDAPGELVAPLGFLADGGVVGWQNTERRPYVWNADGVGTAYPVPPDVIGPMPVGVGDGYLYGIGSRPADGHHSPVRWKIGTGAFEWLGYPAISPPAEELSFTAVGTNGAQLIEAVTSVSSGPFGNAFRSFVVRGGHLAQLPAPEAREVHASAMSEYGTKVAGRVSPPGDAGTSDPALWTC